MASTSRLVEEESDSSLIHGFDLKPHADEILQSKDLSKLQAEIEDIVKPQSKKSIESKTLFNSLSFHYPNSLSFKLARLINLNPSLYIRTVAVDLLHHTLTETHANDMRRIHPSILMELRNPLLQSFKMEHDESLLPPLSETIGNVASRVYEYPPLGGWEDLLEYVCSCVSGDSKLNQRKGLMLIMEIPVDDSVARNREFWENGNYIALISNVLFCSALSTDLILQELKFDALIILMGMSKNLGRTQVCDSLLPVILEFIDRRDEEKTVVNRLRGLADLVSMCEGEIFKGKECDLIWRMLRLVEVNGASEEIRCAVIHVIKELRKVNKITIDNLRENLSPLEVNKLFPLLF